MDNSFSMKGPSLPNHLISMIDSFDAAAWRDKRMSAADLDDLVSPTGHHYFELNDKEAKEVVLGFKVRIARTKYNLLADVHEWMVECPEVAYYCPQQGVWIQGLPKGDDYDSIGPLSGSKGINMICRECGHSIAYDPHPKQS